VRRHALAPLLASLAAAGGARRVLDVGGYDGAVAADLGDKGSHLVVLDVDGDGLRKAAAAGMLTVLASATAIPLASASVDLVLCCDVLPCVSDDEAACVYPEIRRVLAAGGRVVVTEVDDRFSLPFVRNVDAFARWQARTGGLSSDRLSGMLGDAGLSVVEHRRFYGLPTRLAYAVLFFWRWPRRGARAKQRVWRSVARLDRRWCPRPRAHVIVAGPAPLGGLP